MRGTPGSSRQTEVDPGVVGLRRFPLAFVQRRRRQRPVRRPGKCVAGVVVRELTEIKGAEEWLHAFLGAHELHQALPPAVGVAAKRCF